MANVRGRVYTNEPPSAALMLASAIETKIVRKKAERAKRGPSSPPIELHVLGVPDLIKRKEPPSEPIEVLAIYAWMHEQLYSVRAEELYGAGKAARTMRAGALARIRAIAKCHFRDSLAPFVEFLAWSAGRERDRLKRNASHVGRIGWRLQFSDSFLTDWRVARARAK